MGGRRAYIFGFNLVPFPVLRNNIFFPSVIGKVFAILPKLAIVQVTRIEMVVISIK